MPDDTVTSDRNALHRCDLLCPVAHLMRGAPVFVDPESTLRTAAQAMVGLGSGAAVVLGPDGPTGIVTERDIVRALANQADPDTVWVADVASTDLVAVDPATTVSEAIGDMAVEGIRHIPVKANGEVVGLVAAEDILNLLDAALFSKRAT